MAYTPDATYRRWSVTTTVNGGQWIVREDSKGRCRRRVRTPQAHVETRESRRDGQPLKQFHGNGAWTEYGYHGRGRVTAILHKLANGTVLDALSDTHDDTGRVLTETDAGGRVHSFGYNLRGEQHPDLGPGGIQYAYDLNGNRTSVTHKGVVDSTATFAARYDAYGKRSALDGTDGGDPTAFQFSGERG